MFDGQNHTIKGCTIDKSIFEHCNGTVKNIVFENVECKVDDDDCAALVTYYADYATFDNITFKSCNMDDNYNSTANFAFLVGSATNCTITNCTAEDCKMDVSSDKDGIDNGLFPAIGMFVGYAEGGKIWNCHVTGADMDVDEYAGGIIGFSCAGTEIGSCSFNGYLESPCYAGGIVGAIQGNYNIHDCINKGHIKGHKNTGGILGYQDEEDNGRIGTIKGCINEGRIESDNELGYSNENFGGIAGGCKGDVINCINKGTVSDGDDNHGGIVGFLEWGSITGCINFGSIECDDKTGGIVGQLQADATLKYCLNMGSVSGDNCGECVGYKEPDCTATDYFWLDDESDFDVDNERRKSGISSTLLKSGMLAYYVNNLAGEKIWGQTMNPDGTSIDSYPTPDAPAVYFHDVNTNCKSDNATAIYNNKSDNHVGEIQINSAGKYICSYCTKEVDYTIADYYYKINNATDLVNFSTNIVPDHPDACAVLMNNIYCDGISWTPIGTETTAYKGTFNGQNHYIKNLVLESDDDTAAGLFGYLGNGAVIENIIIDSSCSILGGANRPAAGIAGCVNSINGETCYVTITNCGNEAQISGNANVAGILGAVYNNDYSEVIIKNCYNTGIILGNKESAAICGYARKNFTIENCWNSGKVNGYEDSYTFVRYNSNGTHTITNCYSTAETCQDGITYAHSSKVEDGSLCWMLNGGVDGNGTNKNGWYQILNGMKPDSHPTFIANSNAAVYRYIYRHCDEEEGTQSLVDYTNSAKGPTIQHDFNSDGICTRKSGETHYEEPSSSSDGKTYYVSMAGNLCWIAENVNNGTISSPNIELAKDITFNRKLYVDGTLNSDLSEMLVWTPIGTKEHPYLKGTFDGNGHDIRGLYVPTSAEADYVGLFGVAYQNAVIKNVGITDSYLRAGTSDETSHFAGAIVGCGVNPDDLTETTGAVIQNCFSCGGDVIGYGYTGGIAGYLNHGSEYNAKVTLLYSTAHVSSQSLDDIDKVGSLFGYLGTATEGESYSGALSACFYQTGKTKGTAVYGTEKSENAFKYGEICSLLNHNHCPGLSYWEQRIDAMDYPYFGNDSVCYQRNISNEWGTVMVPFNLTSSDDITFYTVSSIDSEDNGLYLKKATTIEPNTPCFFHVNNDATEILLTDLDVSSVAPESTQVSVENNGINTIGSYVEQSIEAPASGANYYIADGKMWLGEEAFTLPAFRAYINTTTNGSKARSLIIFVGDGSEATAIGEISADGALRFYDGPAYNLAGQRQSSPAKGQVNIMNGKKVIIK